MPLTIPEANEHATCPAAEAFLAGGGEMGARMRAQDWSATPVGPAGTWPAALKTLVAVMLGAYQPMCVIWGPARIMLYNDGYVARCGTRHPAALGRPFREVWFDILDVMEPILDRAFAGEGTQMDDMPLVMHRHGYPEETFFSFSYTPVRDESGAVAGVFCVCTETTGRVMAERRQEFRLGLEARLRTLAEPQAIMTTAAAALAGHLGCDRAGYAEIDGEQVTVSGEWCGPGVPDMAGPKTLRDYGPALVAALRAGRTIVFADVLADPLGTEPATAARFRAAGARASVIVPLVKAGCFAAAFWVQAQAPRRWREDELVLVQEVAERSWTGVSAARAEAALRASEARWRGLFARMQEGFALCEVVRDPAGRLLDLRHLEVNAAWERVTGLTAASVIGRQLSDIAPDIDPFWPETLIQVAETGQPAQVAYYEADRDRWFEVLVYRTEPDRVAVLFLDITGRKRAETRQALLTREIEHRAKNALAVVQSVLRLTRAEDLPAYIRAVEGRVAALARAQSLLTGTHGEGAELRGLLAGELAPFLAGQRVELEGPMVLLPARVAQPVAMAVHELATNAVKHGALSVPGGRLAVHWNLQGGQPTWLELRWAEAGGPAVAGPPSRRGFGSRVLDGTVRGQLGGRVALDWDLAGLVCQLELPLGDGMG